MFLPLSDDQRLRRIPFQLITAGLISFNVIIWLYQFELQRSGNGALAQDWALYPQDMWVDFGGRLISYNFLHSSRGHISGNMIFLWTFGAMVEDRIGHVLFLLIYLLMGMAGGIAYVVMSPESLPVIGASGAISGVAACYLILYGRARIFGLLFYIIPLRIPAWLIIPLWIGFDIFNAFYEEKANIAWYAHIGGSMAGLCIGMIIQYSKNVMPAEGMTK